jgi:NitT/TauT family transport system permease protein
VTAASARVPQAGPRPAVGHAVANERLRALVPPVGAAIVVLLLWEFLLEALGFAEFLLPRPTTIITAFVEQWPVLQKGILYTGFEALAGFVVGVTLGVIAAFATARWATAREALMPVAIAASSIPIIAMAPISSAWFGVESPLARIFIVTLMVFFPVMVNTVRGLTSVEPAALELMRSYAAGDVDTFRHVRIPNALPFVFTALRIAATLSVIGAVIGEYFGGPRYSLGIYISSEAYLFRYPNAWAGIVCACLIGTAFFAAVLVLERIAIPWHRGDGREA